MKVQFMQPAHGGAVAQFERELFLQVAVNLDPGPMDLTGRGGIFQNGQEQIAHALQFDFARAAGPHARDERINAAPVELFDPQAEHALRATELLANAGAAHSKEQGADGVEPDVTAFVGCRLHRHAQFLQRGVLRVGL